VVFTVGNRKEMDGAKSEKESRVKYTIQAFAREFFDANLNVPLLAAKTSTYFFSIIIFTRF
jgi:hypothetical protein